MTTHHRILSALSLFAALAACTAPGDTHAANDPARSVDPRAESKPNPGPVATASLELKPAPWTRRFTGPAVLFADRIRIEGPKGLLEHLAFRSEDALFERTVETVPEGFLQTIRPRVLPDGGVELVRGQLDAWQLAATREIVALERPGNVPIVLTAEGDASWRSTDGEEQRGPRLRFEATVESEAAQR